MPEVHAIMLMDVAPKVAEQFRTDAGIANLLDPAVYINANEEGCIAKVVERLEITEMMSDATIREGNPVNTTPPENAPILILVSDETGCTTYCVPDPRIEPECWPWMGLLDDED